MDPYLEQMLREEVIYLHSLWHQGPPSISSPYNLQPLNSTHFKKHKKKTHAFGTTHHKKIGNFSGTEWPVKPLPADPPLTQSGWPELKLKPNPQTTRLPTQEELEKYKWNQVQQRALKAAKEFYSRNREENDEDDDEDDMDEDDDDDDIVDEEYDFFWKLFNEDEELKSYYLKHCGGGGDFSCLVCGGANEKFGKRFKDGIALVQHSISIAKTKKRRSHRAYGQVICKVLQWDIDRLPSSIVADHKSCELQGNDVNRESNSGVDPNGANYSVLNEIMDNGESNLGVDPDGEAHDALKATIEGESMVYESSLVVANVEEENTVKQVFNEREGGVVSNLCRNLSSTMVLAASRT